MKNRFISIIVYIIAQFIYLSTTKKYYYLNELPKNNFILTFWHGSLLFQPYFFHTLNIKKKLFGMISRSKDGQIIANIYSYMGAYSLRGSSSKGASSVLRASLRALKNGHCIAYTPDGPRGPIFSIANGLYALSHKTNTNILVSTVVPTRYWRLKSWDQFIIPKPFSDIQIYFETLDITNMNKDDANSLIREKMSKYAI